MAAGLIGDLLAEAGVHARIQSAGLLTEGRPASAHGVKVMATRGIDISDHSSQYMTADLLNDADLVVGMERRHIREAAVLWRPCFEKSFTLPDLARRAAAVGRRLEGETPEAWIARAGAGRKVGDLLGDNPDDDVADPYGLAKREYERTAVQIESMLKQIVDNMYPADRRAGATSPAR